MGEMTMSFPNYSNLIPKSCDQLNQPIRGLHLFKSLRLFRNLREFVRFHQKFHPHLKSKAVGTALLKRQRRASVSIMQDTEEYENDLPQPSTVPIPLPREQDKNPKDRPTSVQIDTSQSIYEKLDISPCPSSRTPRYVEQTQEVQEGLSDTIKKAPLPSASSAFVHYLHSVLDILDRRTPQTPLGM